MNKRATLLLVTVLMISSLIIVSATFAQAIPKPSVPEFTLKYADHSYDVAPTTTSTTNPYNNQTTTTTVPGYHVQNMTIDLTIKNQPVPPSIEGNKSYLLFYVRLKGHYGDDWIYPYTAINSYPVQSNSDYTIISFPANYGTSSFYGEYLQAGDQIDFQIKSILAYGYNYSLSAFYPVYSYDYTGVAASDWSETQTLTIEKIQNPSSSPEPTPPTLTPESTLISDPNFIFYTGIALLIVVVAVFAVFLLYFKKRKH